MMGTKHCAYQSVGTGTFTGCVAARSVTHFNPCLEYSSQQIINPSSKSAIGIMHGCLQSLEERVMIDLFACMLSALGPPSVIYGWLIR